MAMRKNILNKIYGNDPQQVKRNKRFSAGTIVSVGGGEAVVDVGATLRNGQPAYLTIPLASGYSPSEGQIVSIQYANDNLHSAFISGGGTISYASPPGSTSSLFTITLHVACVGSGATVDIKQAATLIQTISPIYITGVMVFARDVSGTSNPTVDVYKGASSILSAPVELTAQTAAEAVVLDDMTADNAEELSVRCNVDIDGGLAELQVTIWLST
jgi:hypothetical protein